MPGLDDTPFHLSSYVTKYERAVILGHRALQLASGSPPLIEAPGDDYLQIAAQELDAGVLPVRLRRAMSVASCAACCIIEAIIASVCSAISRCMLVTQLVRPVRRGKASI